MKSNFSRLGVLVAVLGTMTVATGTATAGLVHWYKFDDTGADNYSVTDSVSGSTGGTIADTTFTRGYTLTGGPLWTADGKIGGALQFKSQNNNGVGLEFEGILSPAHLESNSYTVSAWIKGTSFGEENVILAQYQGSVPGRFLFEVQNGALRAFDGGEEGIPGVSVTGTTTLSPETWYHVAITNNDKAVTLYLNGMLEATGTFNHYAQNTSSDIGGMNTGLAYEGGFNGYIDDVRIYNAALSAGEVSSLYASAVPEPSALALCVCGILSVAAYVWRRR